MEQVEEQPACYWTQDVQGYGIVDYFSFIPSTHRVEGCYSLVPTENACNRQKDAWLTLKTI